MAYKNFKHTEIIEEIGAELRKARLNKNETLAIVSDTLSSNGISISPTMLGRIENGERRIDDKLFFALCDYYEINPYITIVSACKQHINTTNKNASKSSIDCTIATTDEHNELISLYKNINSQGQNEIKSLMRMMAYMSAFKLK